MDLFDRFLQERLYLSGGSSSTLRHYRWVRGAFAPILNNPTKTIQQSPECWIASKHWWRKAFPLHQ
jgi:hypothetical protein